MTNDQAITCTTDGAIATITLNRPASLNAFTQKMRLELIDATALLEQDDTVRVVILTGAGRAFSAGADLTEGMPGHANFVEQCAAEYKPWLMAIHDSAKIYIAAVNGVCAGIASAVALNCDLVVMAEDAYLYQAFSAIGLMPDGGATWLLLQRLGYQRAFELAVDAGKLSAEQCSDLGIANKVVANDQLLNETQTLAERLAAGAPLAQGATKKLMRRAAQMSYSKVIDEEARLQTDLIASEDSQNAAKAFLEKRKPVFRGR